MKKTVLFLTIALFFIFSCKYFEDFFGSDKDIGEYTKVELRIKVIFSGLNSDGIRKVTIDNVDQLEENFHYDQNATEDDNCDTAHKDMSHTFDVTITKDNFKIILEYIDWDFVHFSYQDVNYKVLCSEWSATVRSYEYKDGKEDPGPPLILGLEDLELETDKDCQADGDTKHDCITTAVIEIERDQS